MATTSVHPLRACQLCSHSRTVVSELLCACPAVVGNGAPVPCQVARTPYQGCGPEALHLHWPALEARSTPHHAALWVAHA